MATPTKAARGKRAGAGQRGGTAGSGKTAGEDEKAAAAGKKASNLKTGAIEGTDNPNPRILDAKSLGEEACSAMGSQAWAIIERLVIQAMKGDVKSAHMLVGLAKKEEDAKEVLRHGPLRSQALAWAAELPWQEETVPEPAEISDESQTAE